MKTFTFIHVLMSLMAIAAGFVVVHGMVTAEPRKRWTRFFLTTTVLTSVTGFFFPFHGFTPALGTGILSMILLGVAIYARYPRRLAGAWRKTYVITATTAQYLNVFVLVVQSFQKVPALKMLAPTQSEPPFALTQLAVLMSFIVLGVLAAIRFRVESAGERSSSAASFAREAS